MIKIIDGNLFDSKAEFIVHQVNCQGVMGSGVAAQVAEMFPHVETEYRKYLRYCKKNKIEPLGTAQYVPSEVWAVMLVDTMKNEQLEPCEDYQYIVNLFGQSDYGEGLQTNLKAVKNAFIDICNKAKSLGATIAMPYKIGSHRGGADWNDMYKIIEDVFENSGVNVEIWRLDLG